jgi:hypothetical protein
MLDKFEITITRKRKTNSKGVFLSSTTQGREAYINSRHGFCAKDPAGCWESEDYEIIEQIKQEASQEICEKIAAILQDQNILQDSVDA